MKYLNAALFALIYFFLPLSLPAQYPDDEETFFLYRKFYLQAAVLKDAAKDENIRRDLRAFMRNFSEGIYAISAGDLKKAKAKLLKARAIWPEYFGADFLLARVNEDMGDYNLSARFYKSYLNKLRALSEGRHRISETIIRGITPYGVEKYDDAYVLVKYRLKDYYGIDLAAVRPFYAIPGFLVFLILIVALGSGYAVAAYWIVPHIEKRRHDNNPPHGFWACKKCGTYNINIRKECEKCGEKMKGTAF